MTDVQGELVQQSASVLPTPLMQVEKLSVEFANKVRAVRDVDLTVYEGETLGLVGESGCGKSTLGKAMLRVIEASGGDIRYRGLNITKMRGTLLRSTRAELQMVFQDPFGSLNPRRKVADIVAEPLLRSRGADKATAHRTALDLLDLVGLGREAGDRRPHEFSGGQRQRIGIARALAPGPGSSSPTSRSPPSTCRSRRRSSTCSPT